jgi:hypothetical protein
MRNTLTFSWSQPLLMIVPKGEFQEDLGPNSLIGPKDKQTTPMVDAVKTVDAVADVVEEAGVTTLAVVVLVAVVETKVTVLKLLWN